MAQVQNQLSRPFSLVFVLLCLIISTHCSSESPSCELGFVDCPESGNVCVDYLCGSVSGQNECESLESETVCNSVVKIEVQYQLKDGLSFNTFRSKFSTADREAILINIERETQSEIRDVETFVYSSGPFGLRVYTSRSNWYEILTFCMKPSNLFDMELSNALDYDNFIFLPSVSYVKSLTEFPRANRSLALESLFMETSDYSESGYAWTLDGKQLDKNWFSILPAGPNLYRSQLKVPAEEISKDMGGQYGFLYWEEKSLYVADSLKFDVSVSQKPVVSLNGSSVFFIGLTRPNTACCSVDQSEDEDWKQKVRLEFEPPRTETFTNYTSTDAEGKELVCIDVAFEQIYDGALKCSYPYWDGESTASVLFESKQPSDTDFCDEVFDSEHDVTWPKTLAPDNSPVSVDVSCPSGYDGMFSRVCARNQDSNDANWNSSVTVKCHNAHLADSCDFMASYDGIIACLENMTSYFETSSDFAESKFQTGDTIFAISTLRVLLGAASGITNFDLEALENLYETFFAVIQQLVQTPSLEVWQSVDQTSEESFYSNFDLLKEINSALFHILQQNKFILEPVGNETGFHKWTFFNILDKSAISLRSDTKNLVVEFDHVNEAAISLLGESVSILEQLTSETLSPSLTVISSNNQGLYTVRFDVELPDNLRPICAYLNTTNKWSADGCFSRIEGNTVKCRCQYFDHHSSINALVLREKDDLNESAGLTTLERVFKNICSIFAILFFIATLVLVIRFLQPFTERSFVICQFTGGQLISTFFYVVTFVNKVEMSPNSCAALTAITKFFFLYSFLWLRFEAKYTKKSIVRKIKNSVEGESIGRVLKGRMLAHCIFSVVLCAFFIGLTQVLHYFLNDQYPPEFEDSLCEMLQDHYLTNFISAALSILISYLQHLMLFRKLYKMARDPETANAVKTLKFYESKCVRLILCVIYPSILLCVTFQLISYYTDTKVFTILYAIFFLGEPVLLFLYAFMVHKSETLGKRPIWEQPPNVTTVNNALNHSGGSEEHPFHDVQ